MKSFVNILLASVMFIGVAFSQSIQGNYQLNYVTVHYTYEVREFDSAQDSAEASYDITASWPSSEYAAAGMGVTWDLLGFEPGDTLGTTLIPLISPEYLAGFGYMLTGDPTAPGVAINIDLYDDGNFTINDGSTYPTTETIDCSTTAVIPAVAENGTWQGTALLPVDEDTYTLGWGITQSEVFAQFNAPDLATMEYGVDFGSGTTMENWGQMTVNYTDNTLAQTSDVEIYWEAHDGVGSALGVDDNGFLNGSTGVPTLASDTVTIGGTAALLAYYQSLGYYADVAPINVGTYPMINGPGSEEVDENGETVTVGVVDANWGYLFDPVGGDGEPFTGDELFQFTGYYFTYNFLSTALTFMDTAEAVFDATSGDVTAAYTAGFVAVATMWGVDSETAAAYGAHVGADLYAEFLSCFTTTGDLDGCAEEVAYAGIVMSLGALAQMGIDVDDSDHDSQVDPSTGGFSTGRLIWEIDNVCIPDNTTQRVNPKFYNTAVVSVDNNAPLAAKFELFGNYPNPFNPTTSIKFATEKFTNVNLTIYSILGEEVATVHNGKLAAGTYSMSWNGKNNFGNNVPSGMYFYKVKSDNRTLTGKMLLLK